MHQRVDRHDDRAGALRLLPLMLLLSLKGGSSHVWTWLAWNHWAAGLKDKVLKGSEPKFM